MNLPQEKHCKKCDTTKASDCYTTAKRLRNGVERVYLQSYCKPCMVSRSKLQDRRGYLRPSRRLKVLNDNKELAMMQRAPSWTVQKRGVETFEHKVYPVCDEGHRYVGPECLPCKYSIYSKTVV